MIASISAARLSGVLEVPASKSAMQRACAMALLHRGKTNIINPGKSNDDINALGIIQALGAEVKSFRDYIKVNSSGLSPRSGSIDCGESGLSFRMFSILSALHDQPIRINASGSLLKRPMDQLHAILDQLKVKILSEPGEFPLVIKGPISVQKEINIDGSSSSQYLTGLLIALAASARERIVLSVSNLTSKPYIDLTVSMLHHFGYGLSHENYTQFIIEPCKHTEKAIRYIVENDWSSASFFMVAAAIDGDILFKGLDPHSMQADRKILEAIKMAGAEVLSNLDGIYIKPGGNLKAFTFDATDCPDLFPPLAVLAAHAEGRSAIKGTHRLLHKESNRAHALIQEFSSMGVKISEENDHLIIEGGRQINAAEVHSHHDHRIAMATAIMALSADGDTLIQDAQAVSKSYPGFYQDLQKLGASVTLST